MMKRSLKLGAVCLGMAVLLCACGKGSTESTEAASSETETAQSEAVSETVAETEDTNVYPYEYDVESMVKLGEYKGLTYTETDVSVSALAGIRANSITHSKQTSIFFMGTPSSYFTTCAVSMPLKTVYDSHILHNSFV